MGEYKNVPQEINDIVSDNIKKLAQLFPSAVKDGQLDIDALKEELGTFEEVGKEKYEFTWSGKQNAKKIAQQDVFGKTLKFCPEKSKNADTTENIYIEGDNLEALKLLRQNYYNSIKMIYIDPPYNTGNDFVYNDDYSMSQEESDIAEGVVDELGERYTKNVSGNRFHANWCNMIYPRLKLAKDLLKEDGVILINMDENEITNLQNVCGEIFGEQNDLGTIVWDKRNPKGDAQSISYQHEYILVYAKNKFDFLQNNKIQRMKKNASAILSKAKQIFGKISEFYTLDDANKEFLSWMKSQDGLSGGEKAYNRLDKNGEPYQAVSMAWPNKKKAPNDYFQPLVHPKTKKICPVPEKGWRFPSATLKKMYEEEKIVFGNDETTQPRSKYLLRDNIYENIPSLLYYGGSDTAFLESISIPFDTPKVAEICKEHILSFTKDDDIVFDFFSGSATIAHGVMLANMTDNGNRKYIMVQLPEVTDEKSEAHKAGYNTICEIGEERIRRAGDKIKAENPDANIDIGFKVFEIANTNIKWNELELKDEQIDFANLSNNPDQVDFKQGTKDIDIVYEIMLRQKNIPLSSKIEVLDEIGSRTYLYADSYLICLETQITNEMIDKLASLDPTPFKYIFRDSAFKDDIDLKTNAFRRLKAMVEKHAGATKKAYTVEFI